MRLLILVITISMPAWVQSQADSQDRAGAAPALVSLAVNPSAPTQTVGSTVTLTATGTFSDGSTRDVTRSAVWSSEQATIAVLGAMAGPQTATCINAGSSVITAASGTVSGSVPVTCTAVHTRGCGAGTWGTDVYDQSTCGNYAGAPYEDLNTASSTTPPPGHVHAIGGSCPGTVTPSSGEIWRFTANINDGVGGTNPNCIYFVGKEANNFVVDLAGFSLTGGIKCDQRMGGDTCSGITIVNGTVNCNIANGGASACINIQQNTNPSKSILLSHLTVKNLNSPESPDGAYSGYEFAVYLQANGSGTATCDPGARQKTFHRECIEIAHATVGNAANYAGKGYSKQWCMRCTSIYIAGAGGVTAEVWNTVVGNGALIDAYQGVVFFHTGAALVHHNHFPWVRYSGVGDSGRPILFDSAGKPFDQAGGQVFNNLVEAYNNRCVRTRQVNNVVVRDNRFEHIASSVIDPCIMMGGNGDYAEKIDGNIVSHNTFTQAGGTSIEAAESYGLTADSNVFLCDNDCSNGILAASWIAEGSNGLTYAISGASRTADCKVTLNLAAGPSTTSVLAGAVYVNVNGRVDDFNTSGGDGNLLASAAGRTVTYTQSKCSGPNTGGPGGNFWMAQSRSDNFAANGADMRVSNSIVDPLLILKTPFVACGTANPACQNAPQTDLNGGQTQMHYCKNPIPVGGTGALIKEDCRKSRSRSAD